MPKICGSVREFQHRKIEPDLILLFQRSPDECEEHCLKLLVDCVERVSHD